MYFRSVCASAETAPYSAPITPSVISTGAQNSAPAGSSVIPTRRMPNAPSFMSTPACSIETPVGPATWPSCDLVPEEQEEQVLRLEDSENARDQQEQQDEEVLVPVADVPGDEHRGEDYEARQHHEGRSDPVDGKV